MRYLRHGNLLPSMVVLVLLLFLLFTINGTEYDGSIVDENGRADHKIANEMNIRKIDSPNPWHSCYEVSCKDESLSCKSNGVDTVKICPPALAVAGFGKCGTSAMSAFVRGVPGSYRMKHDIAGIACHQDGCKATSLQDMWAHYALPIDSLKPDQLLYNGDINMMRHTTMNAFFDNPKQYFILMVRDYAEMMWSRYNYFCFGVLDGPCNKADMTERKRSPEAFHELIVSENAIVGCSPDSKGDVFFFKTDRLLGIDGFTKIMGADRVLVFADKQLEENPEYVYSKLSEKISFFKDHYNATYVEGFKKVRVNMNDVHATGGYAKKAIEAPPSTGTYSISGHKPMLPETREMLNRCWQDECKYLSELTGYQFPACA